MNINQHLPFNNFLAMMVLAENLSPERLVMLLGAAKASEILGIAEQMRKDKITGYKELDEKNKKKYSRDTKTKIQKDRKKTQGYFKNKDMHYKETGRDTANRVLDNSNNQIGAPALGPSTSVVLHGQLHEFTGAISDVKSGVSKKMEHNTKSQQKVKKISLDDMPGPSLKPKF